MYVKNGAIKILRLSRLHPSALHIQSCLYSPLHPYGCNLRRPQPQTISSVLFINNKKRICKEQRHHRHIHYNTNVFTPWLSSWLELRDWLHWRLEEKPSLGHFFLFELLFWTFSVESIYGPAWECGGDWGKGISNYRQWACPCLDKNRNSLVFCVILKPTSEQ